MDYIILKWIHIVSSTILFGTGVGSAFYMFMVNRQENAQKDLHATYFVLRHVVIADWLFTTPAVIVQLITGLWIAHVQGYDLNDTWLFWGIILYCFVGLCWLPVLWIQVRMRDIVKETLNKNSNLPAIYWKMHKWWISLGSAAFPAMIVIFYLMVSKPS